MKFYDFSHLKKLFPDYCEKNKTHYSENSKILTNRLNNGFFHNALNKLKTQSHDIFNLSSFLIKIVLINQLASYIDGTTKKTIGLSCIDFKDHFEQNDFIELIVHQMTHMILFIDDYSNNHMLENDKELMIETGLKYVFGGTKFPIYIAFHSYIVGIEVLYFRWQSAGLNYNGNYHGDTSRIVKGCELFKKVLENYFELFSARGQSILKDSFNLFDKVSNVYYSQSCNKGTCTK